MAVKGIGLGSIYASDYSQAVTFYKDIIGLDNMSPMNDHSCYFSLNDSQGIYLIGGCEPLERHKKNVGCTLALEVDSTSEIFQRLKENAVKIIHDEPIAMNDTDYWFQAIDPSGNIIEFIGKK